MSKTKRNQEKNNRKLFKINFKRLKKRVQGITLIALVVTVIVLLILAVVAINLTVGDNGLFKRAQNAVQVSEDSEILEELNIKMADYEIGKEAGTETRTLSEFLKDEFELEAIKETKYGTLIFKIGNKIITAYKDNTLEIKDYQKNTIANNAPMVASQVDTELTEEDGFLTDDGIARKYIKKIIFNDNKEIPSSYNISWDVSELADGSVMAYASGDESNGYDVTIVSDGEIYLPENSTSLFEYCGYNESLPEYEIVFTGVNTSKVKTMHNMFCRFGYYSMTNFSIGDDFDISNVTDMEGMFGYCGYNAMTKLDLGNNFDTSNVSIMTSMFWNCGYKAMTSLNLGDKFNTSNVTLMDGMFGHCGYKAMTSLNLGDKFDTSNVNNMYDMFWNCGHDTMTNLNLGDKFDTSNVTNMFYIFNSCGYMSLIKLDLGDKFKTTNVTNMQGAFEDCGHTSMVEINLGNAFKESSQLSNITRIFINCGTSNCKYYVNSAEGKEWLLNLNSSYRRNENWNEEYIFVQ